VLSPMPAEFVKGIAEPVVTYAVREGHRPRRRGQMTAEGAAQSKLCYAPARAALVPVLLRKDVCVHGRNASLQRHFGTRPRCAHLRAHRRSAVAI
jgi:hypothetical protein